MPNLVHVPYDQTGKSKRTNAKFYILFLVGISGINEFV